MLDCRHLPYKIYCSMNNLEGCLWKVEVNQVHRGESWGGGGGIQCQGGASTVGRS